MIGRVPPRLSRGLHVAAEGLHAMHRTRARMRVLAPLQEAPCWCDGVPPRRSLDGGYCEGCGDKLPDGYVAHVASHDCASGRWDVLAFTTEMPCPRHGLLPEFPEAR